MAVKRLAPEQVRDLRAAVQSNAQTLERRLQRARSRERVDPAEVAFYEERLRRMEALLEALPARGGIELEDDAPDESVDEDD